MMIEEVGLSRKHLKGWDRQVAALLMEIVNDHGIKYRMQDGGHLLLYPPDGTSHTFRVAAARRPKAQILYLRKFMEDWNLAPEEVEGSSTAREEE
jgi:hypothetical protein